MSLGVRCSVDLTEERLALCEVLSVTFERRLPDVLATVAEYDAAIDLGSSDQRPRFNRPACPRRTTARSSHRGQRSQTPADAVSAYLRSEASAPTSSMPLAFEPMRRSNVVALNEIQTRVECQRRRTGSTTSHELPS